MEGDVICSLYIHTADVCCSGVASHDWFGGSVVLHERVDGTVQLAVGAHRDDGSSTFKYDAGAVYMFELGEDSLFSEQQLIRSVWSVMRALACADTRVRRRTLPLATTLAGTVRCLR